MSKPAILSLLGTIAVLVGSPAPASAESYIYINQPDGASDITVTGMNSNGDVIGTLQFSDSIRGYVYTRATGGLTVFQDPGAVGSCNPGTTPASINNDGTVVGYYLDCSFSFGSFIRTPDGISQHYTNPVYPNGILVGINNRGDLLGTPFAEASPPFVALASGTTFAISNSRNPKAEFSASHINDNAGVAGEEYYPGKEKGAPFILTVNKAIIPYKLPLNDQYVTALSINNADVAIATEYSLAPVSGNIEFYGVESFVLTDDGKVKRINVSKVPLPTFATALNNNGTVVGTVWLSSIQGEYPTMAFMYESSTGTAKTFRVGGDAANTTANAINDAGEIAGTGVYMNKFVAYIRVP